MGYLYKRLMHINEMLYSFDLGNGIDHIGIGSVYQCDKYICRNSILESHIQSTMTCMTDMSQQTHSVTSSSSGTETSSSETLLQIGSSQPFSNILSTWRSKPVPLPVHQLLPLQSYKMWNVLSTPCSEV